MKRDFESQLHKRSQLWINVTKSSLEIFLNAVSQAEQEGILYEPESFPYVLKFGFSRTSTSSADFCNEEGVSKTSFSRYLSGAITPSTPTRKQLTKALRQKAQDQLAQLKAL